MRSQTLRHQQVSIEDHYGRHNIRGRLLSDITGSVGASLTGTLKMAERLILAYSQGSYYESKESRIKFLINEWDIEQLLIEIMILVFPCSTPVPIQQITGPLGNILGYHNTMDGVRTASELLAVACRADLFDIIPATSSSTGSLMVVSRYTLEEHTLQAIADTKYLPPMVCRPKQIKWNGDCGYLTKNESVILGSHNHHLHTQALDVLNIMNAIPLALDEEILQYAEESKKPLDTPQKADNWRRLVNSSTKVYEELLELGNRFYLTHKYDKRGRIYSQGYHVNIQSTSFKKASLVLADKEIINCG